MNNADAEYVRLINLVLAKGRVKKNRTGIDTLGVFGAQARFDLSEGFPLLTTKKVFFKGIIHELLWFLSGSTNIKYLVDNDVHIWDENAYDKYVKDQRRQIEASDAKGTPLEGAPVSKERYLELVKKNPAFAKDFAELGEGTYGGIWRAFPFWDDQERFYNDNSLAGRDWEKDVPFIKREEYESEVYGKVDQIQKVIYKLKTNPDDRRLIVSAWHPYWVDHCALPPCHCLFQFHTEELTVKERLDILTGSPDYFQGEIGNGREDTLIDLMDEKNIPKRRLNCQLYQRSCDLFLGVPFNIASYALLTSMIAQVVGMVPGEFVHTYGDLHLYSNSIEAAKLQLTREPYELPTLKLNPKVSNLLDFKYDDISFENYKSHPAIKVEMAI